MIELEEYQITGLGDIVLKNKQADHILAILVEPLQFAMHWQYTGSPTDEWWRNRARGRMLEWRTGAPTLSNAPMLHLASFRPVSIYLLLHSVLFSNFICHFLSITHHLKSAEP